jgi:hypothetical protein
MGYERLIYYPRNASERNYEMEVEGRGPGWLRHTNVQDLLASFFLGCHFEGGRPFNWRDMCSGIGSEVVDTPREERLHMPFLDYDGKHIKTTVRQDVKLLQEKYKLGPAHVYHTKRGAHVYFFHDLLPRDQLLSLLDDTNCCPGFKKASQRRKFAVLRVSAKYTDFDIVLDHVIPASDNTLRRKTRKGHLIESLLSMGTTCGTHFASLFPQWAVYHEDPRPWKMSPRRVPHHRGKFIIKQAAPAPAAAKAGSDALSVPWLPLGVSETASTVEAASNGVEWGITNHKIELDGKYYVNVQQPAYMFDELAKSAAQAEGVVWKWPAKQEHQAGAVGDELLVMPSEEAPE